MFGRKHRLLLLFTILAAIMLACNLGEFVGQPTVTPPAISPIAVTPPPPTFTPVPIATIFQ